VASSASEKEIRQAYRRMALKYHPDVNKKVNAYYLSSVCQSCCLFLSDLIP
jgi:DnaJ-class molecular chaperone